MNIAEHTDEMILSLDGPEPVHDAIRRVKGAFAQMKDGILGSAPFSPPSIHFQVALRFNGSNFHFLRETVHAAQTLGLDSISFLAVDVNSNAFNRPTPWDTQKTTAGDDPSRQDQ